MLKLTRSSRLVSGSLLLRRVTRNLSGARCFSLSQAATSCAQPSQSPQTSTPPSWEDKEELLEEYDPSINGYYPIKIGDVLGGHYTVIQKLGWGVYSTVWLVKDQRYEDLTFHALKVLTRVATNAHWQSRLHELDFLRKMRAKAPSHPAYEHVVHLQDHFYQEGPAGRHLCLVMEPLLDDLRIFSLRWRYRLMPLPAVRHLARQIVLGLQYLHDECNIIHTDIKPANILLTPPGDPSSFIATVAPEEPETSEAEGPNGSVVTRVRSYPLMYPLHDWGSNWDSTKPWCALRAKLGDVGVACWADKVSEHFTELIQSPPLRAPEVAIGVGWGKPADIWSLGCTLYELYMGHSLLAEDIHPVSVPTLHTQIIAPYPLQLVQRGKHRDVFFKPDGTLIYPTAGTNPFDQYIRKRNAPDAAAFIDFLGRTFAMEPAERATCGELLTHPWLNM